MKTLFTLLGQALSRQQIAFEYVVRVVNFFPLK